MCASNLFKFRQNPRSTSLCRKSANIDSQFCRPAGSRHEGTSFHRRRSKRKRTRGTRATMKSRKGNAGGPRGSPRPINHPLQYLLSAKRSGTKLLLYTSRTASPGLSLSLPCLLPSSCRHQTKLLFHSSQAKSNNACSTGDTALNKNLGWMINEGDRGLKGELCYPTNIHRCKQETSLR